MSNWPGQIQGHLEPEVVHCAALEGNHLGDPVDRVMPVYLPASYDAAPGRRYPVVYWLHGFTGTALMGMNLNPWSPSLPEAFERAVLESGREAILVLVDGFTRYGGSQYANSAFNGRYEDMVLQDVVPTIRQRYRTLERSTGSGIAGKSSGGYGAMVLGMRHPDLFGAVASVSGDAYFELCYKPDFPKLLGQIHKHGGLEPLLEQFLKADKKADFISAVNIAAMAMAYSPNLEASAGFDLPLDPYTGELRPDVWARWESVDPVFMLERHVEALRSLRLFYVECGTRDEYALQYGTRLIHRRLESLGVAHEHVEFDDGHMSINYRYHLPLARLLAALDPAEG